MNQINPDKPQETASASAPIPPETMAIISAAVTVALGAKARIKRIRYHRTQPGVAWSIQSQIMGITSRMR
jgi:hypothetical protein